MSGFTPGPWVVKGTFKHAVKSAEGRAVCEAWLRSNQEETRANARLIAAAPELLEALVELSEWVNRAIVPSYTDRKPMPANCAKALAASAAAIRKATGAAE